MCVCVCSRLGRAAVEPVGVGVWCEASCRVLVRGDVQRVSLRNPTRRNWLSSDWREWRERRSVRLTGHKHTHTQSGYVITCVITLNPSSAHNADKAPYPVLVGGVSQCEAFNLQNKNAVVELDEVTSLLLPWLAGVCFTWDLTGFLCSWWKTRMHTLNMRTKFRFTLLELERLAIQSAIKWKIICNYFDNYISQQSCEQIWMQFCEWLSYDPRMN